jgi:hypothetical protein
MIWIVCSCVLQCAALGIAYGHPELDAPPLIRPSCWLFDLARAAGSWQFPAGNLLHCSALHSRLLWLCTLVVQEELLGKAELVAPAA